MQQSTKLRRLRKEALAIVYSVQHLQPYLYGRCLTLVTDYKPKVWFKNSKDSRFRETRQRFKVAEYDFAVVYVTSKNDQIL